MFKLAQNLRQITVMHLLSRQVGGKLPCARASVHLAITVTKTEYYSTCVAPLKSGFGTNDERKKEKKRFGPNLHLGRKRAKKGQICTSVDKKSPKMSNFKKIQKFAQILHEPSGNLRGPSGNRVHFSRTFGEASGNLRASFGEPSGGVKNIFWPIFVKNSL